MLSKTLIKYSSLFLRNIDKVSIRIFLESSPQYPNLLSVLQTLRFAGLDAQAGQCDWDYLKTLSSPVMIHVKMKDTESLIISRWNSAHDCMENFNIKDGKWTRQSDVDIMKFWDGVVIYTNDQVLPSKTVWQKIIKVLTIGIILSMTSYSFLNPIVSNFMPVIIGFIVCWCHYLKYEKDGNSIIDTFCHI